MPVGADSLVIPATASGLNRYPVVDAQEEEGHPQPAIVQADQDGETSFTAE
jgi:hypothetical protein